MKINKDTQASSIISLFSWHVGKGGLLLPSPGFARHARSFTSHLREVTNSSHLVKVDTDLFGSAIQVGPESSS